VRTWYFEVWNEPNLTDGFWAGTQQQYFDLYAATARAIAPPLRKTYGVHGWLELCIKLCIKSSECLVTPQSLAS
jgi:xylan 1,4-beta-xylosidase